MLNPLKHHLGFIKEFISSNIENGQDNVIKQLRHIGSSVMDIYTGRLSLQEICTEINTFLLKKDLTGYKSYSEFIGRKQDFRIMTLSDSSQWMMNFHNNHMRFVHIFPARYSSHTFRIKSNTLKSAILYIIFIGKDFISGDDLNTCRSQIGLPPVKDPLDAEAITEMIELLRVVA